MSYADRFHPVVSASLLDRMARFPLLRGRLDSGYSVAEMLDSTHPTTARLAQFLCGHYFDGTAGEVDMVDLLQRLDAANKSILLVYLSEI